MSLANHPIPGPRGLPVIGVVPRLLGDPLEFMVRIHRHYGDLVRLSLGKHTMYLAVHPDMIKRITQENWKNYIKRYTTMDEILGQGLVTSNGELWLRQRRLMQPAFHHQRIARNAEIMVEETERMLTRWERYARSGQPFDVQEELLLVAEKVIVRAMFSTSLNDQEAAVLGKAFNDTLNWAAGQQFRIWQPPRSWPTPANIRYRHSLALLERTVYRLIEERRRQQGVYEDLLEMLVTARDAETGEQMPEKQIRDEVMTIFLAGHETTAGTLAWILHLLAHHGDAERKLRAEYAACLGGRAPTLADLPQLTYNRMVIDETLRLYPPTWILSRVLVGPDTLGGYTLPAGATVALSPYVTHRHPAFWSHPESFDPERFHPAEAAGRHKFAYIPFLSGPRQCIGNQFALMELQIMLPMILQRFRVSAVPGYPVRPTPRATLRPGPRLWMHVSRI
ncbi:MAG: cytochrome P450 [Chloroflexus sp.]